MNKFLLSAFLYCTIHPGIHVMIDLPAELSEKFIKPAQEATKDALQSLSEAENNKPLYRFGPSPFNPHLSLAFIDQKDLTSDEVKTTYQGLIAELQCTAERTAAISLTECLNNVNVDVWDGKFKVMHDGHQKENYMNVILKLADSPELVALTATIVEMLQSNYGITQRFPFSTHLTLGRIYTDEDKPINPEIKEFIKEAVGKSLRNITHNTTGTGAASSSSSMPIDLLINTLNLSCSDKITFVMRSN